MCGGGGGWPVGLHSLVLGPYMTTGHALVWGPHMTTGHALVWGPYMTTGHFLGLGTPHDYWACFGSGDPT